MHPAILDVAGYALLLSGLIALVMLLREGCKYKKRSPFHILSTSDVFSSIVTAVALLASHIEAEIKMSYNRRNDTEIDRVWTIKDDGEYKFLLPRTREPKAGAVHEVDSNMTLTCDLKDILMQYGILLAPLTNALVSLLTFAVQCNLNAACVKRRCAADALRSPAGEARLEKKRSEATHRRREAAAEDQQELASQRSNVNERNASFVQKIVKIFQFQTARQDDKKPAGFLVVSHWLVPFFVTAILCFAEYDDMNAARRTEDTECALRSNFPVNFHVFSSAQEDLAISSVYPTPLEHYHFVHEETSNQSSLKSVEVNRIVSKVQSIVRNVLSYIRNSTENTEAVDFLDISRLRNVTGHLVMNDTSRVKNVTGVDGAAATQAASDTMVERIAGVYNLSSHADNNTHFNQDPQVLLLHDLLKNASQESDVTALDSSTQSVQSKNGSYEEDTRTYFAGAGEKEEEITQRTTDIPIAQDAIFVPDDQVYTDISNQNKNDSYEEDTQTHFAGTEENDTTRMTTDASIAQNTTFVSNDQIYTDILKRIQAASAYIALNSHGNRLVNRVHGKKQLTRYDVKDYIARIKPDSIEDSSRRGNHHSDHRDVHTETRGGPSHMINECLVSSEFLKLHLFVLSFAIYFLPILLCCVLQVRGEHVCKTALEILKAKVGPVSTMLHADSNDDDNVVIVNEGARVTEWLSTSGRGTGGRQNSDEFDKSLEIKNSHGSTIDTGSTSKHHENCVEAQNRDMLLEVNCTAQICRVIKISLILCVILWSPVFLGTLLKVFSCIHAPQWLTDTTFLSAISFGVVRNVLNMYIIKTQDLCGNDSMKENRIHPVE